MRYKEKRMKELLVKDITDRANKIYNNFQDQIKVHMPYKWYSSSLEFKIKDDERINGRSWCEKDKDHIEINRGVIELYYSYFTKVMEQDRIDFLRTFYVGEEDDKLREISLEGISRKKGNYEIYDSKFIEDEQAQLLEIFVSRFIILHELGHILNGHCKLSANKLNVKGIKFIPLYYYENEKLLSESDALDIRTMEMDADAFAATQSIVHLIFLYLNFDREVKINMNPQDIFYWWSFAVRSHFLTCEDKFMDNTYYKKMTHLPSNARWTLIYGSIMNVIDGYKFKMESETFKILVTKGAIDAETKFNRIKHSYYNWEKEISNNVEYINYSNEVNENWKRLKAELQKYARLPLFEIE